MSPLLYDLFPHMCQVTDTIDVSTISVRYEQYVNDISALGEGGTETEREGVSLRQH